MRIHLLAALAAVPFVAAACGSSPDVQNETTTAEAPTAPAVTLDIEGMT